MIMPTDDGYENTFAYTGMTNVVPYLQPIMDARYGELAGAEIVCRVNTGNGVTHNQFYIEKLASSNQADFIVAQLILKTAEHLSQYKDIIKDNFILSLRMTHWQCSSLMLKDAVTDFKALFGRKITLLFEVVEHHTAQPPRDTAPLMNTLRVKSLNDEHIESLRKENITAVKLDPSLAETNNDALVFKTGIDKLIAFANQCGMQIIAEGVENTVQKALLLQAGIFTMRGGLFSPPQSLSDFCQQFR